MRRFGRRLDVERLRRDLPLTPFFFDLLYIDGQPLLDEPEERRFAALSEVTSGGLLVPRTVTASAEEAQAFLDQALARGHEGIMAKALDAPYEAGGRGQRLGHDPRSEEHTSELQSRQYLVCRLLLEKKKKIANSETR